jgi:LPXTG-site transpeptidase (sortase) family protein
MTKQHKGVVWEILEQRWAFALGFFVVFMLTLTFLAWADVLPEPKSQIPVAFELPKPTQKPVVQAAPAAPTRVVAASVGVDAVVANPTSTNIEALDHVLLSGAVRYPTSAVLGVDGTVLLFGHSSSLPVVRNPAYKTFNGIQNLKKGEIISVFAGDKEYRYAVVGVRVADANEDVIELTQTGRHLTLVTCNNSFATKTKRYVVTADLVAQ